MFNIHQDPGVEGAREAALELLTRYEEGFLILLCQTRDEDGTLPMEGELRGRMSDIFQACIETLKSNTVVLRMMLEESIEILKRIQSEQEDNNEQENEE